MEAYESQPYYYDTIVEKLKVKFGLTRERTGIHLSDCLLCQRKSYYDKVDSLPPSMTEILYFILGLALQDTLGITSEEIFEEDGVVCSPDYMTENRTPVELKTTRIGKKRLDAFDFPGHWLSQIMGYCRVLRTTEADLLVLTIIQPQLLNYHLVFTEEEVEENWKEVVANARALEWAVTVGAPPPKVEGDAIWECRNCRYRLKCLTKEVK